MFRYRWLPASIVAALVLANGSTLQAFVRGDADGGGTVDIADAVTILGALFDPGSPALACADAGDANDDGAIDVSDPIYVLAYLFVLGSPPPPEPFPIDGADPTSDTLPACGPLGVLSCATVAQGSESGWMTFVKEVITDAPAWDAFWAVHSTDPTPVVDFDTEMVIVVLGSFDFYGVAYDITQVEDTGSALVIDYTVSFPGAHLPEPAQPHHIIRCQRSLATPEWVETAIYYP